MFTFEDARRLVESAIQPDWRAEDGTLITLPEGWEDATHWQVVAGARENLVDGDLAFGRIDWPALLVDKESGALSRLPVIANFDRLDQMTPVGNASGSGPVLDARPQVLAIVRDELARLHLPGKHDQKSHGRRKKKPTKDLLPAPSAATRELVREVAGEMPVDAQDWDFAGTYPRDSRGGSLPPPRLRARLKRIMEAGKALDGDIRAAIDGDTQIAELRKRAAAEGARAYTVLHGERVAALQEQQRLLFEARRREQDIVRSILDQVRPLGGATHTDVEAVGPRGREFLTRNGQRVQGAPKDWRQRMAAAERMLPTDWVQTSAQFPLDVVGTSRAFHYASSERGIGRGGTTLALDARRGGEAFTYAGAFDSYGEEVTLHELGHRMEEKIPGLKALEFAYVRSRSTHSDGAGSVAVEELVGLRDVAGGSYEVSEKTYKDEFPNPYTGKSYEFGGPFDNDPAARNWEAFQVGLQDVFGRGPLVYGDESLQQFVLGVLATLHVKEKA